MADAHNPLDQFIIQTWVPIKIGGLDASFTNSSAFMLLTVICATALMVLAVRPRAGVPGRWQLLAELSYQFITHATKAAIDKEIGAIVTAPINKKSLNMAGHKYPGHTELIAKLTNTSEVSLMLITNKLKVIHVTTHLGLLDSIKLINPELVYRTCLRGINIIEKLGIPNPKIGVCAINPHAGEDGLFGYGEEKEKILPAIRKLKK